MADSIENIADEMGAFIEQEESPNLDTLENWHQRLRALSPAGGDRAESLEAIMLEHADGLAAAAAALKAAIATSSQQDRPDPAFGPECSICQADMLHEGPCDFINVNALAASPQQEPGAVPSDDELPGMWERADMIGGAADAQTHCARCQAPDECDGKCPDGAGGQTLAGAGGEDWYTSHSGTHCVDWDTDPARQLSLMLKPDGTVAYSIYLAGRRLNGPDAMQPDFMDALHNFVTATSAGTTGDDSEDAAMAAIYDDFCAKDNGDVPLERYPQGAVDALARAGWAVVPCDLPFAVLGDAAQAGVFETGNPKHGWDYLVARTRIGPDAARRAREVGNG